MYSLSIKIRSLIYASLLLASTILAGCHSGVEGDTSTFEQEEKDVTTVETVAAEDASSVLASFERKNYDGYSFRVLCTNYYNAYIFVQQAPDDVENGEPVNDALYRRDRMLSEYYDIDLKYTIEQNDYDGSLVSTAKNNLLADEVGFDLILSSIGQALPQLIGEGYAYDFNQVDSIDLTKEWWNKNEVKDLTINGKLHMATGDITTRSVVASWLMAFNKELFDEYQIDIPYQMVYDGKWTIDRLSEIIKDRQIDLDGDSKITKDDFVGLAPEGGTFWIYYTAGGLTTVELKDSTPVITCMSQKSYDAIDKMISILSGDHTLKMKEVYDANNMFKNDQALFLSCAACDLSFLREMESEYGLLPLPKLSENQESYYTPVNTGVGTAAIIPINVSDIDKTGTIIDTYAALSRYTSMIAQYETTMQQKQARDEDSIQMLKLAVESVTYDFSAVYGWSSLIGIINESIKNGTNNYASELEAVSKKTIYAIEDGILSIG